MEDLIKKAPIGISAHNFDVCDNYGGSSFRDWCMLMRHRGVFIGFRNHNWVVYFASDPSAKFHRGCQESRAHCDPMPRSKTAKLIRFDQLPEEAKDLALRWVQEAINIAMDKIKRAKADESKKKEKARRDEEEKYRLEIENPWLEAVYSQ